MRYVAMAARRMNLQQQLATDGLECGSGRDSVRVEALGSTHAASPPGPDAEECHRRLAAMEQEVALAEERAASADSRVRGCGCQCVVYQWLLLSACA